MSSLIWIKEITDSLKKQEKATEAILAALSASVKTDMDSIREAFAVGTIAGEANAQISALSKALAHVSMPVSTSVFIDEHTVHSLMDRQRLSDSVSESIRRYFDQATGDMVHLCDFSSLKSYSDYSTYNDTYSPPGTDESVDNSRSRLESIENRINRERLAEFEKHRNDLIALIRETDFEQGRYSEADRFFKALLDVNKSVARQWANQIFIDEFAVEDIALGIVQIFGHLDYADACPEGPVVAVAALSHPSIEVRDAAIGCFENWEDPSSISVLKHVSISEEWLDQYRQGVVSALEKLNEKCLSIQEK